MKTETFINLARARVSFFAASLACGLLSLHAEPAAAATIFVNPSCSLQDAVIAANTDQARNGCPAGDPGPDTLELPVNSIQTFSAAQAGGDPDSGITISSPIVINGHGSTMTRNRTTAGGRLVRVVAGGNLTLNDSTLTGGIGFPGANGGGGGGGILNDGSLMLNRCTVSGNFALPDGGGLFNYGTLTLTNSTVSGNSANGYGGGLSNLGTLTLTNSTVSGNTANFDGGGLDNAGGSTTLVRSLISGNFAPNRREVTRSGGSVIGNNRNLFGAAGETNAMAFNGFTPGAGDINATSSGTGTPLASILSPLADNGGPTQTHALPAGSPAIDAAGSVCGATDQRGVNRPQGAACDLGAFEVGTNTADIAIIGSASPSPAVVGGPLVFTFNVSNLGPDTATDVRLVDTLPAALTFVSANPVAPATGSCANDSGNIICALGNLALNQIVGVSIAVTPASAGTVNNTASVISDITDVDIDPSSNASTVSVRINPADTTPDAFHFIDVTGAPISTSMRSNSITVSGINVSAPLVLSGPTDAAPQYSINGGSFKYYNTGNGQPTVSNGDTVQLRARSSATGGATVDLNLSIGSISDTWSLITATSASTPNAFDFKDKTGQPANRFIASGGYRASGINTPVAISISGDPSASFRINNGGYIAGPAMVSNGDLVVLRLKSSATPGASVSAVVSIGGVTDRWTVTTAP